MRVLIYHFAAFLGSFLLFAVQPMTSKALLPGYGGSYLVWAGSMVFYQGLLLAGYLYAHLAHRAMGCARAARLHALLILLPLVFLPPGVAATNGVSGNLPLVAGVFSDLWGRVGIPFTILSTVSLMLQRWLHVSGLAGSQNPYVLYAASNAGSVAALLLYPLAIEPLLGAREQALAWTAGYALLAALLLICLPWRGVAGDRPEKGGTSLDRRTALRLLAASGAACGVLLAVTNLLTFDVASIPFLWTLPLAVYMTAFVLSFKRRPWRPPWLHTAMDWALAVGLTLSLMGALRLSPPLPVSLLLHLPVLGLLCLSCTDSLVRLKPSNPSELTAFYLWIAVGGLLGSVVVGWVVPLLSRSLIEYPLFLALTSLAVGWVGKRDGAAPAPKGFGPGFAGAAAVMVLSLTAVPWLVGKYGNASVSGAGLVLVPVAIPALLSLLSSRGRPVAAGVLLLCAAVALPFAESLAAGSSSLLRLRNYYGVYRVFDRDGLRYLQHGTTQHGRQYISGPRRGTPLSYHHPSTPGGRTLGSPALRRNRVHMIGLGTGAMAAYMGAGSFFTVFELDPDNVPIARGHFTYIEDAERRGAKLRFVIGDGRVRLHECPDADCDVLVVDAFSSGSIPVHLLTVEALREYARVIAPDGLLLMHVSNRYLRLQPVVAANAAAAGLAAMGASNAGDVDPDADLTQWVAVFRRGNERMHSLLAGLGWNELKQPLPRPWTDQYANLAAAWLDMAR